MDRQKRAADAYRRARDAQPADADQTSPAADEPARMPSKAEPAPRTAEPAPRTAVPAPRTAVPAPPKARSSSPGRNAPGPADRESAGFEKTARTLHDRPDAASRLSGLLEGAGPERAARLLIALGTERAAQIMRHLDDAEVQAIAAAIVETKAVSRAELDSVLADFATSGARRPARGGPDVAREMLRTAFGEEEGERRFFRSVPNAPAHHFAFLNDLEPGQLYAAVKDESAAAAALIVAHVDRSLAAKTLAMLPVATRTEVARRIARMGKLSRDVVVRVEEAVREKIRRQGRQISQEIDGTATLAAILHHLGPSRSDGILGELREANVDLSEDVRRKLYSTELLFDLSDRHLADLLREFSDHEIALFLKGKTEALRARVLRALSDRRGQFVSDEFAHLGAQRREEIDRVTGEILDRLRELEEDGSILVPRDGDRYI